MEILLYRPKDDQFWIGCTKAEAERYFLPHMSEEEIQKYHRCLSREEEMSSDDESWHSEIMELYGISYVPEAFFNVSRDLKVCFSSPSYFPFAGQWNAYNPFRRCDKKRIETPAELKDITVLNIKPLW